MEPGIFGGKLCISRNISLGATPRRRMEEARTEAEKAMKEDPSFSVSVWASRTPFLHEKDRQHAVEGFIKAGLPR